jgi:hypothetical protein
MKSVRMGLGTISDVASPVFVVCMARHLFFRSFEFVYPSLISFPLQYFCTLISFTFACFVSITVVITRFFSVILVEALFLQTKKVCFHLPSGFIYFVFSNVLVL